MGRKRYISKKPEGEVGVRDYEMVLAEIRAVAEQQEELERQRELKRRHDTPIKTMDEFFWKYNEEKPIVENNTLILNKPIEVELFVKMKRDCRQLGITNIKIGM
jgi:hypothetical protein